MRCTPSRWDSTLGDAPPELCHNAHDRLHLRILTKCGRAVTAITSHWCEQRRSTRVSRESTRVSRESAWITKKPMLRWDGARDAQAASGGLRVGDCPVPWSVTPSHCASCSVHNVD